MPTRRPSRLAVAALLLLLQAAAFTPTATAADGVAPCDVPTDEPEFEWDTSVRSWRGNVSSNLHGGQLDVRSHRGGAHVVPWNRSAWRVDVAEADPLDVLAPTVRADARGGNLSLTVRVEPRRLADGALPQLDNDAYAQVKVFVPALHYQAVHVSNGPGAAHGLDSYYGPDVEQGLRWTAVEVHNLTAGRLNLSAADGSAYASNVNAGTLIAGAIRDGVGVANVSAREATITIREGHACVGAFAAAVLRVRATGSDIHGGNVELNGVATNRTDIQVEEGEVEATGLQAQDFRVRAEGARLVLSRVNATNASFTGDHDLRAEALQVRNLTYHTRGGDVDASLVPAASGRWNLNTGDGEVRLEVAAADRFGYNVEATARRDQPRVALPNAETISQSQGRMHVRTVDHALRPIQTHVEIQGDDATVSASASAAPKVDAFPIPPEVAAGGLAALLAGALAYLWPKLKPLLAPLYSRIRHDEVLHHPARRRVYGLVKAEPGIHFRELKRRTGAGRGILQHHLDKLVDAGAIVEKTSSGYTCYFVTGAVDREVMDVTDRLRAHSARALLTAAWQNPRATLGELAEGAGVSNSTASYHLGKLAEAGLVEKGRDGGSLRVQVTELGRRTLEELRLV